jgi:hypothetical protein
MHACIATTGGSKSVLLYIIPRYFETLPNSAEILLDFIGMIPSLSHQHFVLPNITKAL